jgi:hypothetical protein
MTAPDNDDTVTQQLALAFAPIHKLALGVAVGMVAGILLFVITMVHVALDPAQGEFLALLGQYFYGYTVSTPGAFIGLFWGFVTGFVAGWFAGFVRNVAITVTVFALRTKAELKQTNDFLDHI